MVYCQVPSTRDLHIVAYIIHSDTVNLFLQSLKYCRQSSTKYIPVSRVEFPSASSSTISMWNACSLVWPRSISMLCAYCVSSWCNIILAGVIFTIFFYSVEVVLRAEAVETAQAGDRCDFTGTLIVVPDVGAMSLPGKSWVSVLLFWCSGHPWLPSLPGRSARSVHLVLSVSVQIHRAVIVSVISSSHEIMLILF